MEWLFCHQWHFTFGGYFAITIHVCLYSHNCYNSGSFDVVHGLCSCLKMQWLCVGIIADRALGQRKHTLEGSPVFKGIG